MFLFLSLLANDQKQLDKDENMDPNNLKFVSIQGKKPSMFGYDATINELLKYSRCSKKAQRAYKKDTFLVEAHLGSGDWLLISDAFLCDVGKTALVAERTIKPLFGDCVVSFALMDAKRSTFAFIIKGGKVDASDLDEVGRKLVPMLLPQQKQLRLALYSNGTQPKHLYDGFFSRDESHVYDADGSETAIVSRGNVQRTQSECNELYMGRLLQLPVQVA